MPRWNVIHWYALSFITSMGLYAYLAYEAMR